MIRVGPDELDLLRFERLVEEAQQATPELAARRLREALDLWRGPPLADLADESFAQTEILRLEEIHLVCVERRIAADLELGRHAELVGELDVLVRDHPLREGLCAQLMLALYRSGRQAEALNVYRETRSLLVDELGIEPSLVLRELEHGHSSPRTRSRSAGRDHSTAASSDHGRRRRPESFRPAARNRRAACAATGA